MTQIMFVSVKDIQSKYSAWWRLSTIRPTNCSVDGNQLEIGSGPEHAACKYQFTVIWRNYTPYMLFLTIRLNHTVTTYKCYKKTDAWLTQSRHHHHHHRTWGPEIRPLCGAGADNMSVTPLPWQRLNVACNLANVDLIQRGYFTVMQ